MNSQVFKQAQQLVAQNSAALLTGTGVVGVVTTAVLTGRAAVKASQVLEEASTQTVAADDGISASSETVRINLSATEQIKLVAPIYAPAVASGLTTIGAIVFSYRISVSRSAALAAAYGISEKAFQEYKAKVIENVTPKKATDIQDAVDQQKMKDNPPPAQGIMIVGSGDVLCLDAFSGNYFQASMEKIRNAEMHVNAELGMHGSVKLAEFYEKVGLKLADMYESFAWTSNNFCEVEFTTQLTDDNRPCLVLTFVNNPRPLYEDF